MVELLKQICRGLCCLQAESGDHCQVSSGARRAARRGGVCGARRVHRPRLLVSDERLQAQVLVLGGPGLGWFSTDQYVGVCLFYQNCFGVFVCLINIYLVFEFEFGNSKTRTCFVFEPFEN